MTIEKEPQSCEGPQQNKHTTIDQHGTCFHRGKQRRLWWDPKGDLIQPGEREECFQEEPTTGVNSEE